MIRIVVADDHTVVREGLKQLLKSDADFEVVGEAQNGDEVVKHLRATGFDILLLDQSMPGTSGIELIKQVHAARPAVRTLVLGSHDDHQYAVRAIRAGAAGWLEKGGASSLLAEAIRKIASGGAYISAPVAEQLALGAMPDAKGPPHAALSDREFQIFRMIAEGMSASDIAAALNLSIKTVSTHKANILQKMHMTTQAELIRYALTHRLVEE
jgi:Response regulator containing a CheY-like receiver domain and an HTH DNA-binding domain